MADLDQLLAGFKALVDWATRERPFLKLYPATVRAQNGDTVDVDPDDASIKAGGLQGIPLRHGLPGITLELDVSQSPRVLLGFEGGDPKRPFAALWSSGGTAKIGSVLIAQNAGSLALLPPQWFPAGTAGDATAAAALAAVLSAGNVGYLLPLTTPILKVT